MMTLRLNWDTVALVLRSGSSRLNKRRPKERTPSLSKELLAPVITGAALLYRVGIDVEGEKGHARLSIQVFLY